MITKKLLEKIPSEWVFCCMFLKVENNVEKTEYFDKKHFLSKRHLHQNQKAQIMLVVPCRLVSFSSLKRDTDSGTSNF